MESLSALGDLIFPRGCVGCRRPGSGLCGACQPAGALIHVRVSGVLTIAATRYDGATRAALLRYKERGRRDLAVDLARLLSQSVIGAVGLAAGEAGGWGPDVVLVPVPSSAGARRARGGDHMLRLTRLVIRELAFTSAALNGIPIVEAVAITRRVTDTAGLSRDDRAENLRLAMTARPPAGSAQAAIIVDDIVTTGATIGEVSRALRLSGWRVPAAAVIAATPRKSSEGKQNISKYEQIPAAHQNLRRRRNELTNRDDV